MIFYIAKLCTFTLQSSVLLFCHKHRSGYYHYLKGLDSRNVREKEDQAWRIQIEEAYNYRGYQKGSRSMVMYFKNILGITINRKKVQRLMRKFDIFCPIRKANPYKRMAKATKEHRTVEKVRTSI